MPYNFCIVSIVDFISAHFINISNLCATFHGVKIVLNVKARVFFFSFMQVYYLPLIGPQILSLS